MAINMMVSGGIIKEMAKEPFILQMAINITVIG